MRKVLFLLAVLMLTLAVTKAQDTASQAPIIASAHNKLYAVSPEDGSSKVLAETSLDTDTISQVGASNLSPDGKQLVYVIEGSFEAPTDQYKSDLYVVNIADGKTEKITPRGGVFDIPALKGQVIQIMQPTWSSDGQRIYYYRGQYALGKTYAFTLFQLGYYEVATGKHELVTRIDPKNSLSNLQGVSSGVVASWYSAGDDSLPTSVLYGPDNHMVRQVNTWVYSYTLRDGDTDYYAAIKDFGNIESLEDIVSGDKKPVDKGYYPAAQSYTAGQNSIHIFQTWGDKPAYHIYGADRKNPITTVNNDHQFTYAIAPDGQSMAYVELGGNTQPGIHIMDMKGNVRKLNFDADTILWGAVEYVPFQARG
jgi:dipeptidyl aminopeptidase/acylaminoacyl peptidase